MGKKFYKMLSLVLVCTMAISLSACGTGTSSSSGSASTGNATTSAENGADEAIKIGIILQLSGNSPKDSEELLAFCKKIVDVINNETDLNLPLAQTKGLPNLGGRKVELVIGDAKTNDVAMSEVERLITNEGVVGLFGIIGSAGVKTSAVAFEKYRVPYVTNASSPTLTKSGYEYLVRIFPHDGLYVEAAYQMMKALNERDGSDIKTVGLCSEDTEFGVNIANLEANLAEEYGFEVVENISYSATATNVTSEILRLKAANPDVVMMSSYTADAILFMQGFKEQNYFPKILLGQRGGFSRNEMFSTLGTDFEYVTNTTPWADDLSIPNAQLMVDLYKEQVSDPNANLQEGVLRAATDFYSLCLAINQAGSTDPDAIMEEYRKGIDIPENQRWIPVNIKVDENGQNLESSTLVMQVQEGAYHTIFPFDFASKRVIFPAPGWNER